MGMDLKGRSPMNDEGKTFTVSLIRWRSILETMENCHSQDILGETDWKALHCNDGAGPSRQEVCEKLATGIEQSIEDVPESDSEHARNFIRFLRNCGGFRVW